MLKKSRNVTYNVFCTMWCGHNTVHTVLFVNGLATLLTFYFLVFHVDRTLFHSNDLFELLLWGSEKILFPLHSVPFEGHFLSTFLQNNLLYHLLPVYNWFKEEWNSSLSLSRLHQLASLSSNYRIMGSKPLQIRIQIFFKKL